MSDLKLRIGDVSDNGQVTIVDEDRLCYQVKSESKGAVGIRTISKALLKEFVQYLELHPDTSANQARDALSGTSEIDKYEYGYASTLAVLAKMALHYSKIRKTTLLSPVSELDKLPLQQIFYGAPGTGKSFAIKEQTEGEDVIRTTFHPDSDYSTFVGCYKPTSVIEEVMTVIGTKAVPVENQDGSPKTETKIVYDFVPQAFLQAYVSAWQKYAQVTDDKPQKQYLVVEEINRGNCAQIFGDFFQLLDRNAYGFSEYPIKADADLKKHLKWLLKDLSIENADAINALYKGEDVVSKVLNGDELLLPSNLYIWATMNTSDQSLFPIDSAFKRRWDWQYVPIANTHRSWAINVNGKHYDWWDFLEKVNALIGETTNSEDKKLGYFFCKAQDGIITAETFVGKVIFYLWNDVFKDFEFEGDVFIDSDGSSKLTYDKFYSVNLGGQTIVNQVKAALFLTNLGVRLIDEEKDYPDEEILANPNDHSRYSFNGSAPKNKADLGLSIMKEFIENHPEMTFEEIKKTFPDELLNGAPSRGLIVESNINLDSYARYYSQKFSSYDGVEYRVYKQWTINNIDNIIAFAKQEGWTVEVLNNDGSSEINDDNYKESISEIRFPDGTIITTENQTQFNAFIEALQKIGIDKVFSVADELKYQRLGCPILSREKYPEIENSNKFSYHQIGDYYIVKGAKPYTSVRIIEDLSKLLDLSITVICNRPE